VYEFGGWRLDFDRHELLKHGVAVQISARAFEIIEVLVQSADEVVTKDYLMGRIWPGASVTENTLQVHISAIRKALGPDRKMLKTASGHGYRLTGDWKIRREGIEADSVVVVPEPRPQQRFRSNLPFGPELIGRAAAVDRLRELLPAYRVVTLTGPGGIGKTRLATEVARGLGARFQGDVWHVELVSLSDPSLVPSAVAGVLGLEFGVENIFAASVADAIGRRKMLLLLDNCEHVIESAATLAEAVVHRCPNASVLATSRELLRVDGEYAYRVPPLDVPPPDTIDPEEILRHSAVRLFIARTQSARSEFTPRDDELRAIGAICRRLDGIPLAIEIAASRAATLGIDQVISRLDNRFDLSIGGRRTALPRHQTLRATLDWSYDLLSEMEQRLLRRLAIFVAGFTLDTATAMMSDIALPALSIEEGIASLVAKSLISMDGAGDDALGPTRWRLLETTRAYARDKLEEQRETDQVARRHAEVFRDLVSPAAFGSQSQQNTDGHTRYAEEIGNIRSALDWAFSPNGDAALGAVLTAAYVPIWLRLALMQECRSRVEQALASSCDRMDPHVTMRLNAALAAALLYTPKGAAPEVAAAWKNVLALAERLDDTDHRLWAEWGLWNYQLNRGDFRDALLIAQRFRAAATVPADLAIGDRMAGISFHFVGEQALARRHLEAVVTRQVDAVTRSRMIRIQYDQKLGARAYLPRVLWLQGFPEQAMRAAESVVRDATEAGHALSICLALSQGACPAAMLTGKLSAAERYIEKLVDVAVSHSLQLWRTESLCHDGILRVTRGDVAPGLATFQIAAAELLRNNTGMNHNGLLTGMASALAGSDELAQGLTMVIDTLVRCEHDHELWCMPELLRARAECLLRADGASAATEAEALFQGSLECARRQGSLSWELRTAVSLARLRVAQDRPDEARRVLAPIRDQFTEGFDTVDLRSATALLEALKPDRGGRDV
jgi:predicted ATPase/DNA-binding winged helix-turn-helix (wHTH) protein